ncbi:endonuclease/exonuclease/phosphatase family protein [Parasphingorhabdus sp. JC815]|uniref:endonuclease/exonuclease/phosphatase family protein n=1 Tax=Parasphingorhabdus sp. JC815 TaxID=3232140 RepID=UPI003458DA3E
MTMSCLYGYSPARTLKKLLLIICVTGLSGCADHIYETRSLAGSPVPVPEITRLQDGLLTTEVSVLIYNVEGLPWPARSNRKGKLRQIADVIKKSRENGNGPDFIFLQEAFSKSAAKIAEISGYQNVVAGPRRSRKRRDESADIPKDFKKGRRRFKGERFGKFLNSGLYVLTDHEIISYRRDPFSKRACAGFDCLANKGILSVRAQVAGVPTPIDLFTVHMNSQKASGVKTPRANKAHEYQVDETTFFLRNHRDTQNPFVFAGDFNMRNSSGRLEYFSYQLPYNVVRHYCTVIVQDCQIEMSWDGDEPWLDTQDLQFFGNGQHVKIRPIHAKAMFDEKYPDGKLSDHDGYLVTYRLSWDEKYCFSQ